MFRIIAAVATGLLVCSFVGSSARADSTQASWLKLDGYSAACKAHTLNTMGWHIETIAGLAAPQFTNARSCWQNPYGVIEAVHLPANVSDSDLNTTLDSALRSDGVRCLFQQRFNSALEYSEKTFKANHLYQFMSPVGRWFMGKGDARLERLKKWTQEQCENADANGASKTCFLPKPGQVHAALSELDGAFMESDCLTGLELVEYSALNRMFGDRVDDYFANAEFYLGANYYDSQSIMGQNSAYQEDWYGLVRAQNGPSALIGAPGVLIHTPTMQVKDNKKEDLSLVDDADNKGENYAITEITPTAVRALLAHRGANGYDRILNEIWQRASKLTPFQIGQLEALLADQKTLSKADMPSTLVPMGKGMAMAQPKPDDNFEALVRLLNDPFLHDTIVYVHPIGFKSFAWHILRLARLNPRTAFSIKLYPDTIHGEFFERWLKMQLDSCEK